jgi:predicted XRE-type DNA-binding protein
MMKGPPQWRADAKRSLAAIVCEGIKKQGLTQDNAAVALGISQPKVSALMNGRLDGFSLERLIELLGNLGRTVKIQVSRGHRTSRTHFVTVSETGTE